MNKLRSTADLGDWRKDIIEEYTTQFGTENAIKDFMSEKKLREAPNRKKLKKFNNAIDLIDSSDTSKAFETLRQYSEGQKNDSDLAKEIIENDDGTVNLEKINLMIDEDREDKEYEDSLEELSEKVSNYQGETVKGEETLHNISETLDYSSPSMRISPRNVKGSSSIFFSDTSEGKPEDPREDVYIAYKANSRGVSAEDILNKIREDRINDLNNKELQLFKEAVEKYILENSEIGREAISDSDLEELLVIRGRIS
jgi:hypothetical protein